MSAPGAAPTAVTSSPGRPSEITVADVLRAVEGPLAAVQGIQPQDLEYAGAAEHLPELWIALRASLRGVLEKTSSRISPPASSRGR